MVVTILTSIILFCIPGFALKSSKHSKDLALTSLDTDTVLNVIKAVGITILPYNGYQSVVQMSEEVEDTDDVPKGMIISGLFTYYTQSLLYQ